MPSDSSAETYPWPTEAFERFLEARGRRVVRTASASWYEPYGHGRILMPLPVQRFVSPARPDIADAFRQAPSAWFLRYASSDARAEDCNSFNWVRRRPYGIESLSAKVRKHVRRSLRALQARRITFAEILRLGGEAHADTMRRHGEKASEIGLDASLDEFGAYEAWGVFSGDALTAYAVTLTMDDWVHILVNRSANRYLRLCPNNALVFFLCEQLFARSYVETICYGMESLDELHGLTHFKSSMGFRPEPIREVVAIRPSLRFLLNRYTISMARPVLMALGVGRTSRILDLIRTGLR